ncbi:MAG: DNA polymerase III subunit delta [Candidatus Magasanikbacteria bacterium]|nr:DNA polymerase III subunit delta [Candidatus Magasanikbacteria bacterium]
MIIFLYGADTFRSRQQLKKVVEKFKKDRDPQGLNVVSLDCQKEEGGKIWEQILTAPFLAEKRMVVLENLLLSKHKDLLEELKEKIESKKLSDATVLVFWEADDKVKGKEAENLFKCLAKEKFCQRFDLLVGVKLNSWILQEVKDRGGKIDQQAAQYLAQNVGGDMWRLNSLIDQLVAFKQVSCHSLEKGNPEIALSDVQLFLDEKADDNIFNLVDAVVAGRAKDAYKMIREQYRLGEDAQYVFAMLLRQFRILLELRDLHDREDNLPSDSLAKKLSLHPFVVRKSLPFIKKYSLGRLKDIYQRLLDLDIKTKTGQGDQSLLLDVFVGSV